MVSSRARLLFMCSGSHYIIYLWQIYVQLYSFIVGLDASAPTGYAPQSRTVILF